MEAKYRNGIIATVVVTFLILIGMIIAWNMVLIRPQKLKMATTETKFNERKQKAGELQKATLALQAAQDQKAYLQSELEFFRNRYRSFYFGKIEGDTPEARAERIRVWRTWMNEYYQNYATSLISEIKAAANDVGVIIRTSVSVERPPRVPEEVKAPSNGFFRPSGTLSFDITGDLASILRFLTRINRSRILMVVGNVKLDGYSPDIKCSFQVTPYLLARGEVPLATAAGAAPAGGAGAAPGGPPGAPGGAPPGGATPPAGAPVPATP